MRLIVAIVFALSAVSCVAAQADAAETAVCPSLEQTRADQAPPELEKLAQSCSVSGTNENAVQLAILAVARRHYDAGRFKDRHAFRIEYEERGKLLWSFPADTRRDFQHTATVLQGSNFLWSLLCIRLGRLPPPDYEPVYMARRFPNAPANGVSDMLKADFDAQQGWAAELDRMGCAVK